MFLHRYNRRPIRASGYFPPLFVRGAGHHRASLSGCVEAGEHKGPPVSELHEYRPFRVTNTDIYSFVYLFSFGTHRTPDRNLVLALVKTASDDNVTSRRGPGAAVASCEGRAGCCVRASDGV